MLPKKYRITKPEDFNHINKNGQTLQNQYIVLKYTPNTLDFSRFGFIVSNRISKKATVRNKIKRQLREIVRLHLEEFAPKYDIVIYTKGKILNSQYDDMKKSILKLKEKMQ